MGELWRKRKWRKLLNFIDHLPRNSFFMQAVSLDDEHVEMILASRQFAEQEPSGPSMAIFSPEVERLDGIRNDLQANTIATLAAAGAKKLPRFTPRPVPETAFDRVAHRRRSAKHQQLVKRLLPHSEG